MFSFISSMGFLLLVVLGVGYLVRNRFPQWPGLLFFQNRRRLLYLIALASMTFCMIGEITPG